MLIFSTTVMDWKVRWLRCFLNHFSTQIPWFMMYLWTKILTAISHEEYSLQSFLVGGMWDQHSIFSWMHSNSTKRFQSQNTCFKEFSWWQVMLHLHLVSHIYRSSQWRQHFQRSILEICWRFSLKEILKVTGRQSWWSVDGNLGGLQSSGYPCTTKNGPAQICWEA